MLDNLGLSNTQQFLIYIGFILAFFAGILHGMSGRKYTWERKFKPYAFWIGLALIVITSAWTLIDKIR